MLRRCFFNSLPHYLQQAPTRWSDLLERYGAGGGDNSLFGRHHGLELVQGSDHHPQGSSPTTQSCTKKTQHLTTNKEILNEAMEGTVEQAAG
jgi:hypothetical protein